ncbi:MAG TPA: molecular chaperone [Limnobacter sp.]|nr:molecular chaperone [Limnobacter sp.]
MFNDWLIRLAVGIAAWCACSVSCAGVVAASTRLVVPGNSQESTLALRNLNTYPVLVQAWIDDGNPEAGPDETDSPFVVLPPVFKMEVSGAHTLRILHLPQGMPTDRETLHWLNVLEVPPKVQAQSENASQVVLTMRTQMKVFVRPSDLDPGPDVAASLLTWQLQAEGETCRLHLANPSPYYVSFLYAQIVRGSQVHTLPVDMVEPFGGSTFDWPSDCDTAQVMNVQFASIDDLGNPREHSANVILDRADDALRR